MSEYGSPTRGSGAASNRERMLSMVAAALGVLMFVWGFMKWLSLSSDGHEQKYAGYAFGMPTTAVIGFSLAAGLMALLGAIDRRSGRGVPSAIPTALAATALLLAIGVLIAKDSVSPEVRDDVNVEIGLILALITAILQTVVLALGLASRKDDAANTGAPTYDGQSNVYAGQHGQAGPQAGYAAPLQPGQASAGGTGYPPNA